MSATDAGGAPRAEPELQVHRDIAVYPFASLLGNARGESAHRGGPDWPDWEGNHAARFCRNGRPVDDRPEPAPIEATLDGPHAWGGPVIRHFGHMIADFSMRYGPTVAAWPEARFVVSSLRGGMGRERAPGFVHRIHAWFGIGKVRYLQVPTRIGELCVAPQGEQIGRPPSERSLDHLDALAERRLGPRDPDGRPVYVSRSRQRQPLAGEAVLDRAMEAAGARVIYPEELDLFEQLRLYRNARELIFAEGSAIHALQLLGRGLGDVTVLVRRPGRQLARDVAGRRAASTNHLEALRSFVAPLNRVGGPAVALGLGIPDARALRNALAERLPKLRDTFDIAAFNQQARKDTRRWIADLERTGQIDTPGSREAIAAGLRGIGLDRLADDAMGVPR